MSEVMTQLQLKLQGTVDMDKLSALLVGTYLCRYGTQGRPTPQFLAAPPIVLQNTIVPFRGHAIHFDRNDFHHFHPQRRDAGSSIWIASTDPTQPVYPTTHTNQQSSDPLHDFSVLLRPQILSEANIIRST